MEGIKNTDINFPGKRALVTYNESQIPLSDILEALESAGYPAELD